MAVRKETAWAELSIRAHVCNWNNDSRMLYPVWEGFCGFVDGWKGGKNSDESGGGGEVQVQPMRHVQWVVGQAGRGQVEERGNR